MGRNTLGIMLVACGLALGASAAEGQAVRVGGQVSFADDADFGIGPRLAVELPSIAPDLWAIGSFDYFFPDDGFGTGEDIDYWEINGNLAYAIRLPDTPGVLPYVGAGINIARLSRDLPDSPDVGDTQVGLNLLGGLDFPLVGFTPFVEARLEIDGGEQFVVTGGITFP